MEHGLTVTHVNLQPGQSVEVKGTILPSCTGFEVNLGKDCDNLILHFNPRFNCKGDMNTIVCNSKRDGVWGEEERETKFPFEQGGKFQASFNFASSEIKVTLPEDQVICFPNLLDLDVIDYIEVAGDFKIKVLKFP
ncbi:16 kDa beta-galactoside-binding lectin-like [Varanus komodoensis]|uniref:Galectin n=1 Tax=Varanus komodoensis TaxID=61221 RepID=A0A8D2KY70_VARKO|nr:16 kDa beta-galactoside-binding lectin-like [Varanus komodoensis]